MMKRSTAMHRRDILKPAKPAAELVCICVPLVGSDGKLIPQPSPDCPIAEHSQLAKDLIAAAQGKGRP
jgi:hypothetical protein